MPTIGGWATGSPPGMGCSSTTASCAVSFTGSVGSGWSRVDVSYSAAAGGGVSPYAMAGAAIGGEWLHMGETRADATNIYAFYIEPIGDVGGISSIPINFSFSIGLTATAFKDINNQIVANSTASAQISVTDILTNPCAGNIYREVAGAAGSGQSSYEKTGTKNLSLYPNRWYLVGVGASAFAVKNQLGGDSGGYYFSSATANADPTIVIDPIWQHANYFRVAQFSVEPPSSTVPEPSTLLLLGSSVGGLALIRNRRLLKKYPSSI